MIQWLKAAMSVSLIGMATLSVLSAQVEFVNEDIGSSISSYGRIRVYSPAGPVAADTVEQLKRLNVLVGVDTGAVFDYQFDQDVVAGPAIIASPQSSTYELWGVFNNGYSLDPPDVEVTNNIYGWSSGAYLIMRFMIKNTATSAITALLGGEVVPKIDESLGNEIVGKDANDIVYMQHGDTTHVGVKILSHAMTSLRILPWYSGFGDTDSLLYSYMNHGSIDPEYASDGDGTIVFPTTDEVTIGTGDSVAIYFGVSVGTDSTTMVANMELAEAAYAGLLAIDSPSEGIPVGYQLSQNYPNPFNPSTTIEFSLSAAEIVLLNVYDLGGKLVTTLVDDRLPVGPHLVEFSGENLSTGVYFYTLKVGKFSTTRKMILLK